MRMDWDQGNQVAGETSVNKMRALARVMDLYPNTEQLVAFILGAHDIELSLANVLTEIREIYRPETSS